MSDSEPRYQTRSSKNSTVQSGFSDQQVEDDNIDYEVSAAMEGQPAMLTKLIDQNEKLSSLVTMLLQRDEQRDRERTVAEKTLKDSEAAEKHGAERFELEKKRLDLDQEMFQTSILHYQMDKKERKKMAVCQTLKPWDDKTDTEAYLENFETSMKEAEIPEKDWIPILRRQLTGRALTAFKEISPGMDVLYKSVRDAMMERMGATARQARRSYWLRKPQADEGPQQFLEQALRTITRVSTLMTSPQEVQRELFSGLVYRYFSEEAILLVEKSTEESLYRLTQDLSQLWQSKDAYGRRKMMPTDLPYQQRPPQWRRNGGTPRDGNYREGGYHRDRDEGSHREGGSSRDRNSNSGQQDGIKGAATSTTANIEGESPGSRGGSSGVRPSGRDWGDQRGNRPNYQGRYDRGHIICFNCQQPGHIRSECPEPKLRLARLTSPGREVEGFLKEGFVNGIACQVMLDSGAMITAVPSRFVPPSQYLNKQIEATMADMSVVKMDLAKVVLEMEGVKREMQVIVLTANAPQVLLGTDHPVTKSLISSACLDSQDDHTITTPKLDIEGTVETKAITRAQHKKLDKEIEENKAADISDGATPIPVSVSSSQDRVFRSRRRSKFSSPSNQGIPPVANGNIESREVSEGVCSNHCCENTGAEKIARDWEKGDSVIEIEFAEDEVEENGSSEDKEEAVCRWRDGCEGAEPCDLPLPVLCKGPEEVQELVAQQQEDESLSALRTCGEKQENGYTINASGVLLQIKYSDPGREFSRVVVPSVRRKEILDVAHKGLVGGHFSHNRMFSSLERYFTWPGMRKDVKQFCSLCPECQKAGKVLQPKVPLVRTPIISVPYQRLACDLVGPLPRTKSGYRYILTAICLGTRYPYCVPLKRVDSISVAEGLMDIISYTGIPKELLSDQGSVFMGKVTTQLCQLLNVRKLNTTAYHPQTNGVLERWHGCLKNMLRRLDNCSQEWDRLLKYCLLAYRATPHTATGFSPYELVNGQALRGPLEAMRDGWIGGELNVYNAVEWVQNLRSELSKLHELARAHQEKYKTKMKEAYDQGAKERSFELGDMVLVHNPSLSGSLESIWEGPYEVISVLSPTSYRIAVPNKRSHTMVVHINRLKLWRTPTVNLFRVVVAKESEGCEDSVGKVKMGSPQLSNTQENEIDTLLEEFNDVVTKKLGKVTAVSHPIDTGEVPSIRSHPYRIAPGIKEDLHKEIQLLVQEEIVAPSRSPWSSPMVPVRKTDGTLRLCIDFRRLNKITTADPYQMPRVEDLLDEVAEASWLSKLDMNRGFYQVPLHPDAQPKTAFCSPWGKFQFTRMPFGLKNAPATFQRCMDEVLGDQSNFSSTYIDDVIVYSRTWEDHLIHIRDVLIALRHAGLTAKPSKCVWGAKSLSYLGHTVGYGLVKVPEARVLALKNFHRPINKKQLRSFLGTAGYYRRFIPGFSVRAGPLYDSLKKEAPFVLVWDKDMIDSFEFLISVLCSSSVLWLPREDDEMLLHTDASGQGLGAVLSAIRDDVERPLGYYSQRLSPAEKHYAVTELECLAVIRAIDHFAIHLVGKHFRVITDHKALSALHSSDKLNGRLMRWALALQDYDFDICHRTGASHLNADGLSRQAWQSEDDISEPPAGSQEGEMSGFLARH